MWKRETNCRRLYKLVVALKKEERNTRQGRQAACKNWKRQEMHSPLELPEVTSPANTFFLKVSPPRPTGLLASRTVRW